MKHRFKNGLIHFRNFFIRIYNWLMIKDYISGKRTEIQDMFNDPIQKERFIRKLNTAYRDDYLKR